METIQKKISVKRLSSDERIVTTLYSYGFTPDEIAQRCGLSAEAIALHIAKSHARNLEEMLCKPISSLLSKVDTLELLYRRAVEPSLYEEDGESTAEKTQNGKRQPHQLIELKAVQGIERCIELRMKLLGLDGKQPLPDTATDDQQIVIDLNKLSESALKELLAASDSQHGKTNTITNT